MVHLNGPLGKSVSSVRRLRMLKEALKVYIICIEMLWKVPSEYEISEDRESTRSRTMPAVGSTAVHNGVRHVISLLYLLASDYRT